MVYEPEEEQTANNAPVILEAPFALRVFGTVILACLSALLIAVTIKVVRWIIGF